MASNGTPKIPSTSNLLKEGRVAVSLRAQNRAVSGWLPAHHTGYCHAASEYVRYLLGHHTSQSTYPESPTTAEILQLPNLSYNDIITNTTIFTSVIEDNEDVPAVKPRGRGKACWVTYRNLFLADLARCGIPRVTFQWTVGGRSHWNEILLAFFIKHWNWAKEHGAFSRYSINPAHSSDVILKGVMERWLRGRAQQMRSPDRRAITRKKDRKKLLFEYRRTTIVQHLGLAALDYLPHVDCCSDTEEDNNGDLVAVRSCWREETYETWLHTVDMVSFKDVKELKGARRAARRLDARRKRLTNDGLMMVDNQMAIAPNLPPVCYRQGFLSELRETERYLIIGENSTESLDSLLTRARDLLK